MLGRMLLNDPTLKFRETHNWCSHWSIAPVPCTCTPHVHHACALHLHPTAVNHTRVLQLSTRPVPCTCVSHLLLTPVLHACILPLCVTHMFCVNASYPCLATVPHSCGPPLQISPVCQIHVGERNRRPVRMRIILEFSQI